MSGNTSIDRPSAINRAESSLTRVVQSSFDIVNVAVESAVALSCFGVKSRVAFDDWPGAAI